MNATRCSAVKLHLFHLSWIKKKMLLVKRRGVLPNIFKCITFLLFASTSPSFALLFSCVHKSCIRTIIRWLIIQFGRLIITVFRNSASSILCWFYCLTVFVLIIKYTMKGTQEAPSQPASCTLKPDTCLYSSIAERINCENVFWGSYILLGVLMLTTQIFAPPVIVQMILYTLPTIYIGSHLSLNQKGVCHLNEV